MATESHPFYSLWAQGDIRDRLFAHLSKSDICAVRLSNSACCNLVTRRLFQRIHLTFTPNSFTRPYRVEALARIGHHVEHLTFYMPHSEATFLPPLIHPATGAEISYLYTPHTSMASTLTRPKYGNSELGDILTQQYPPLFHASTNVPSFINAVKHLSSLRHLTIKTPGQKPAERYRRDIVDYALMSLRIAIERSPGLTKLSKLSLHGVHPAAFLYLKFQDGPGFGCSPMAGKRWRQIRRMAIAVEAWDFYGPGGPGLDQLKIIDNYLRQFTGSLEKLSFTWIGQKGPCPLALAEDPLFDTPRENRKLFNEVTSPMSPLPPRPGVRGRIRFRRLKNLSVRNASMHAAQLRGLVETHRKTVKEFDFENVVLHNGGNWDEALAPLMSPGPSEAPSNRDTWARYSVAAGDGKSVHSVHTQYSESQHSHSPGLPEEAFAASPATSRHSIAAEHDDVPVRHMSAAVEAAGKELLDLEVEGLEAFVGLRLSHSQSHQTSSSDDHGATTPRDAESAYAYSYDDGEGGDEYGYYGDEQETIIVELDEEIDSAINLASTANASEATLVPFSTKLKKRVRRRRRKPWHPKREGDEPATDDDDGRDGRGLGLQPTKSNRSQDRVPVAGEKQQHTLRNMLGGHKRSNSSSQVQTQHHHQPNKLQKPPPPPVTVYGPAAAMMAASQHQHQHQQHSRTRQSSDPMPYMSLGGSDCATTYELPLVIASDDESLASPPAYHRTTQWPRPRAASEAIPPPPSYLPPPPPSYATLPRPAQSTQSLQSVIEQRHDDDYDRYHDGGSGGSPKMEISAPIISTDALPVLLQPTVYSPVPQQHPSTTSIPIMSSVSIMSGAPPPSRNGGGASLHSASKASLHSVSKASLHSVSSNMSTSTHNTSHTNHTNNGGGHNVNEGLSAVQRNLEQEEIQRRFAEDAEARAGALKRAREAVLEKLGRLNGKGGGEMLEEEELLDMHPALQDEVGLSLGNNNNGGGGGGGGGGRPGLSRERSGSGRLKELFGAVRSNGRVEGLEGSGGGSGGSGAPLYQQTIPEGTASNSVLVPLVFSRN